MNDWIDAHGFRANVGIVLIRDAGDVFLGGAATARLAIPQAACSRTSPPSRPCSASCARSGPRARRRRGARRDAQLAALPPAAALRPAALEALCIGQKQRWFLLRMLGGEDRLRFDVTRATRVRQRPLGRLLGARA